jgi:hypothetical protein
MKRRRVVLELTEAEVETLLLWAERATRGLYQGCERYLGEAEAALLAKLEACRQEAESDEADR